MSRWYRAYAGMVRDAKLVRAAMLCKQTIERVVWVWAAILESAAEIDDHGRFEVDAAEIAYFLRADEADIQSVLSALAAAGRVAEGAVVKWGARQFQSDRSAARQSAHRERKQVGSSQGDGQPPSCDGEVTAGHRHGDAPETETETDTSSLRSDVGAAPPPNPPQPSPRSILEAVLTPKLAAAVLEHRQRLRKPLTAMAAEGLAKGFDATGDPDAAARMMIERGWQGFKPQWFSKDRDEGGHRNGVSKAPSVQQAAAALDEWARAADGEQNARHGAGPPAVRLLSAR